MRTLLSAVARTFLRAFIAAAVIYAYGVLAAPDLKTALTLAAAAVIAAVAAGLRSVTVYIPKLTVAHWIGDPWGSLADAFLHVFVAAIVANWLDLLATPHYHGLHDVLVAVVLGLGGAAVRGLQGLLTAGESPAPTVGLPEPAPSAATPPVSAPPPPVVGA